MREIKFRAWDGKKMLYRGLCDRNWYNTHDKLVCEALPEDAHNWKISQYTGLKDKNGVEIYEGDIVRNWDTVRGNDWREDRVFSQVGCISYQNAQFTFVADGVPEQMIDLYEPSLSNFEVIGNIYENPELLNNI